MTEPVDKDALLPVPVGPAREGQRSGRRTFADFAAHVLGQEGRRRGLRGGPETLDTARRTYLETEYSGPADRRPRTGLVKRTDV